MKRTCDERLTICLLRFTLNVRYNLNEELMNAAKPAIILIVDSNKC